MENSQGLTSQQFQNLKKSLTNPVWFAENVIGITLDKNQAPVLNAIATHRKVAWRSGHGIGKTALAAVATLWFLTTRPFSKVPTTATAWRQVSKQLWPEIHKWRKKAKWDMIGFQDRIVPLDLMLKIDDEWFATGEASDEADRMEGFHAPYLFYIVDEGKAVPYDTYEAIEGAFTNAEGEVRQLVISTPPLGKEGYFWEIFSGKRLGYQQFHTSCYDSNRVSPAWIEERKAEWGETSAPFIARVLGEFPEAGENSLIPYDKMQAAVNKEVEIKEEYPRELGIDVARFGDDKTVFIIRRGPKVLDISWTALEDTMQTAGRVVDILNEHNIKSTKVDVIGVGGGVVDRLIEQEKDVTGVNVAESASDTEKFANLRAENYWGLRQRFIDGDISIPDDSELLAQLSNLKYKYNSRGQLQIESKEEMKKRGLPSPDKADALMLAFAPAEKVDITII